ncbi:MAG: ferric reductase-like transmembrane domain-containing protein [Chloroflexi bacterium]|nr:ferric reductase-like transmembrane domain-containing protein [Chloroflexota bacterium]MCC6894225.1 ferric reductase-like transmembrane domain-containing protein [Anaerolineae bacterium]
MLRLSSLNIGWQRWRTHFILTLLTISACFIIHLYTPYADWVYVLTLGCGYLSLSFIVFSLLIGPYKLLHQRRNPVNLDLRRDVGIWAGITGCVHVVCAIAERTRGNIIDLFLRPKTGGAGYDLLLTPGGISNNLGLVATVILVLLLVISNDFSLRRFKGKRWKFLQRFNYLLALLVFIHTVLYQQFSHRERSFILLTIILAVVLLLAQFVGVWLYKTQYAHKHAYPQSQHKH